MNAGPEVRYCRCACHDVEFGNYRALRHAGAFDKAFSVAPAALKPPYIGVDVRDILSAWQASGCACINEHCAVFDDPLPVQRRRSIWVDAL